MAKKKRASELEYLKWFRQVADFGPADGEVKDSINEEFIRASGKRLPEGWDFDSSGEKLDGHNEP